MLARIKEEEGKGGENRERPGKERKEKERKRRKCINKYIRSKREIWKNRSVLCRSIYTCSPGVFQENE